MTIEATGELAGTDPDKITALNARIEAAVNLGNPGPEHRTRAMNSIRQGFFYGFRRRNISIIREYAPHVAAMLCDGLNVTLNDLKRRASSPQLDSQVALKAILNAKEAFKDQ